jgi:hypothetical protein
VAGVVLGVGLLVQSNPLLNSNSVMFSLTCREWLNVKQNRLILDNILLTALFSGFLPNQPLQFFGCSPFSGQNAP